MAVKVAGIWETGWQTPLNELALWEYAIKEFGITELIMSPVSGVLTGVNQTFLVESPQIETTINEARAAGMTVVYVDESAPVELAAFVHPENALYVLGKTGSSPFVSFYDAQQGDMAVKIATVLNQGGLWSHQAAAMILHDRFLKAA